MDAWNAPIHVELLLVSSLNGAGLGETLHYLDRPVELSINELARVQVHLAAISGAKEMTQSQQVVNRISKGSKRTLVQPGSR